MTSHKQPSDLPIALFACLMAVSLALIAASLPLDPWRDMPVGGLELWATVALAFFALLSAIASVAIFLGRGWGRAVLAAILDCTVLVLIFLAVIDVREKSHDLSYQLASLGVWILSIAALLTLILILHSGVRGKRRARRETGADGQAAEIPTPPVEASH